MRAIGAPMPKVEIAVPAIEAPWPPPGGGVAPVTARDRISVGALRAFGKVAPRFSSGVAVMMLHLAFLPERTIGVDTVFELDLSGPGGGRFTVDVHDGVCDITVGAGRRVPDVVYSMSATTWREMAEGRATGDEAVLFGKLTINGDPTLARRFNEYFQPAGQPAVGMQAVRRAQAPSGLRLPTGLAKRVLRRESAA